MKEDISLVETLVNAYYYTKAPPTKHVERLKKYVSADGKLTKAGIEFVKKWFTDPRENQPKLLRELCE